MNLFSRIVRTMFLKIFELQHECVPNRPRYVFSGDLRRSASFAMMLAHMESSSTVVPKHVLGALYIVSLEKLSKYWGDWEEFQRLVANECGIGDPRWEYWAEYHEQHRRARPLKIPGPLSIHRIRKDSYVGRPFPNSPTVERVYAGAQVLAQQADATTRGSPLITSEHVLLALAEAQEIELGKKLRESGLDLGKLKDAVRNWQPTRADYG